MIGVLGISHKTSQINIREKYYLSGEEIVPFSEFVLQQSDIDEIVVLSTCNRTEIYFYKEKTITKKQFNKLTGLLRSYKGVPEDHSGLFYSYTNKQAVGHLFRVTSGMDSMLVGENQIVNQVKDCYLKCTAEALTSAVLMRLFQKAFETSKHVRSETNMQQGATSLSYVAVDMCVKKYQDISDKKILLIGTGETGKIAMNYLKKQGVDNFFLTNRTYQRAVELKEQFGGITVPFEKYKDYLPQSDIVITATESYDQLIQANDIRLYSHNGNSSDQLFLDLSVPRNIDESIGSIHNKEIIAIDDLQSIIEETSKLRTDSFARANEIIVNMVDEFYEWYDNRQLRPLIKSITNNLQEIHTKELNISRKCYTDYEFKLIKEYSHRLAQKYTRNFIKQLKIIAKEEKSPNFYNKIQSLFKTSDK